MYRITFLGDIMCDNKMAETLEAYFDKTHGKYNFNSIFVHIKELLSKSDYVLANLETPISFNNEDLTNKLWEFCSPYEFAEAVKEAGINFVSTANNHCLDRGLTGLESTVKSLNKIGFEHCGIRTSNSIKNYVVTSVGQLKIGILSYTYGTNAFSNHHYLPHKKNKLVNLLQEQEGSVENAWIRIFHGHFQRVYKKLSQCLFPQNINKQIYEKETLHFFRKLLICNDLFKIRREKPDYLFALLHIGGQYNDQPASYTRRVSRWFEKKGCNAVIDNHEHVIHGINISHNKLTAYALGNCVGSAGILEPPYDRRSEYSIALHIGINSEKEISFISFSILKTIKENDGKLSVWPAFDLLQKTKNEKAEKLRKEILSVAKDFSGISYDVVCSEYTIYGNSEDNTYA